MKITIEIECPDDLREMISIARWHFQNDLRLSEISETCEDVIEMSEICEDILKQIDEQIEISNRPKVIL